VFTCQGDHSAALHPRTIQQATPPVNALSCAAAPGIRWVVAAVRDGATTWRSTSSPARG